MSQSSSDTDSSRVDDPRRAREELDEDLLRITEEFGMKLGSTVKSFLRNTKTSKDEIKAMIRCLGKCINSLHGVWNSYSGGQVFVEAKDRPVLHLSDYSSKDELRSGGRVLLRYFKNQSLDSFLTAFEPHVRGPSILEGKKALLTIDNALKECAALMNRVINKGYDCASTTDEESDEEN